MEKRTARFTILVDPKKRDFFARLCDLEDITPSQKMRQFMRDYIEQHVGPDWREKVFMDSPRQTENKK